MKKYFGKKPEAAQVSSRIGSSQRQACAIFQGEPLYMYSIFALRTSILKLPGRPLRRVTAQINGGAVFAAAVAAGLA